MFITSATPKESSSHISASRSVAELTSHGNNGWVPFLAKGPSDSVTTRCLGILATRERPFSPRSIAGPTLNQQPRRMARSRSLMLPEYQWSTTRPARGCASKASRTAPVAAREWTVRTLPPWPSHAPRMRLNTSTCFGKKDRCCGDPSSPISPTYLTSGRRSQRLSTSAERSPISSGWRPSAARIRLPGLTRAVVPSHASGVVVTARTYRFLSTTCFTTAAGSGYRSRWQ